MSHFLSTVTLCVVPSFHNSSTTYKWLLMGSSAFQLLPSSPVVFVEKEGVYCCQVSCEGVVATASTMHVRLKAVEPKAVEPKAVKPKAVDPAKADADPIGTVVHVTIH